MLTIVGEQYARKGVAFTYLGETDEGCGACRLRQVCHRLTPHREYEVTGVRPMKHDVCHVFEGQVQVVEVAERPVRMNVPVASLRGTAVSNQFDECGEACALKPFCNPPAVPRGRSAAIVDVDDAPVRCKAGRDLRAARVEPQ